MTSVVFQKTGERYVGFSVSGHAAYDAAGSDIVCAALSSATQLTANGITEVAGVSAHISVDEKTAAVRLRMTEEQAENPVAQAFCSAFFLQAESIAQEYPTHVKIILMEV